MHCSDQGSGLPGGLIHAVEPPAVGQGDPSSVPAVGLSGLPGPAIAPHLWGQAVPCAIRLHFLHLHI